MRGRRWRQSACRARATLTARSLDVTRSGPVDVHDAGHHTKYEEQEEEPRAGAKPLVEEVAEPGAKHDRQHERQANAAQCANRLRLLGLRFSLRRLRVPFHRWSLPEGRSRKRSAVAERQRAIYSHDALLPRWHPAMPALLTKGEPMRTDGSTGAAIAQPGT